MRVAQIILANFMGILRARNVMLVVKTLLGCSAAEQLENGLTCGGMSGFTWADYVFVFAYKVLPSAIVPLGLPSPTKHSAHSAETA